MSEIWPGDVIKGESGTEWRIVREVGTGAGDNPCDSPDGGSYLPDGRCRCIVCSRCGHHTGNSHQGHYWAFCKVTRTTREFHLCCPGDCELEVAP